MNPIIQHDLMQARIADLHRPPGRINAGSRKHTAISRIRWYATALLAGAMVFLAGAPAALAVRVPPLGGSAGTPVTPPPVLPATVGGTPGWQIVLIAVGSALDDQFQGVAAETKRGHPRSVCDNRPGHPRYRTVRDDRRPAEGIAAARAVPA